MSGESDGLWTNSSVPEGGAEASSALVLRRWLAPWLKLRKLDLSWSPTHSDELQAQRGWPFLMNLVSNLLLMEAGIEDIPAVAAEARVALADSLVTG